MQRDPYAPRPTLFRLTRPRMVHQNAPHLPGHNHKEMFAIVPMNRFAGEAQVDFVHQRGRLQRMIGPLLAQMVRSQIPQFPIHALQRKIAGVVVAFRPAL